MRKLHAVVTQIVDDFRPTGEGAALTAKQLATWAQTIRRHPERRELGVQLVALAIRFAREHQAKGRDQLVLLAVIALGAARTVDALERGGVHAAEAKALVAQSRKTPETLIAGLAVPQAGTTAARAAGGPKGRR